MKQTNSYLARPVDQRMVDIITTKFTSTGSVVDVACGSGLYGESLAQRFKTVYGIDYDKVLCDASNDTKNYTEVYCDRVENMGLHIKHVDAIFCSEFIEHVANKDLRGVLDVLEATAQQEIIITVPNPLSPHFKHDPTHILKYSVTSLLDTLNESKTYSYKLLPLGFSEYNLSKGIFRLLNIVAKRVGVLSPTVLYVGTIRK